MLAQQTVARIMTGAVLCVEVTSPAGEVLRLFTQYPVHHLPVVDGTRVVGMLSSADVLKLEAFLPKHSGSPAEFLNSRVRIETLMRKPAITVQPEDSVLNAAQLMATHGIHSLAVVDGRQNLIGIVTTTDVMNAALFPERCGLSSNGEPNATADRSAPSPARLAALENVLFCAERYVRAGQDETLHTALVRAIETANGARDAESAARAYLA